MSLYSSLTLRQRQRLHAVDSCEKAPLKVEVGYMATNQHNLACLALALSVRRWCIEDFEEFSDTLYNLGLSTLQRQPPFETVYFEGGLVLLVVIGQLVLPENRPQPLVHLAHLAICEQRQRY